MYIFISTCIRSISIQCSSNIILLTACEGGLFFFGEESIILNYICYSFFILTNTKLKKERQSINKLNVIHANNP